MSRSTAYSPARVRVAAEALLANAAERLGRETFRVGLYAGFTGVAWALELLAGSGAEGDDDPCAPIDAAVAQYLDQRPWDAPYDLVEGLVGIGVRQGAG